MVDDEQHLFEVEESPLDTEYNETDLLNWKMADVEIKIIGGNTTAAFHFAMVVTDDNDIS